MAANSKPGIAKAYFLVKAVAVFTAKFRNSIISAVQRTSPDKVVAVTDALDKIQSLTTLFADLYEAWVLAEFVPD